MAENTTAAILIIGDEILSGRTRDANVPWLADRLNQRGIALSEVRIVPDVTAEIIAAVNALRARHDYVFTTGGIGPTHDDITAAAVAQAFGVALERHPEAVRILTERIGAERMNEARLKMADVPAGGTLIVNAASGAPGFRIGNVFVLAGVPAICQAMYEALEPELEGGTPVQSATITVRAAEGDIADMLGAVQDRFAAVSIGSYPVYERGRVGVHLVLRSPDDAALTAASTALREGLARIGIAEVDGL